MNLPLSLGDNLVLRRAETEEDIERIIALDNLVIQEGEPGVDVSVWVRQMTRGDHPTTTRRDFYLVEDTRKDLFVSSLCLIPKTWTYDGIPFGAGRPEIVMTLPEYRRRGLVRRQFEALHADCAARGLLVQGIAGIPFYYRLFDYEYALSLQAGCDLYFDAIPERKADEAEPYPFRLADEADLPQLIALAGAYGSDKLVTCVRDETLWHFVLNEPAHADSTRYYMLTDGEGGPVVGYFGMLDELRFGRPALHEFALVERVPYAAVVPSLLRALRQLCAARWSEIREIQFELGDDHPRVPDADGARRAAACVSVCAVYPRGRRGRLHPARCARAGGPAGGFGDGGLQRRTQATFLPEARRPDPLRVGVSGAGRGDGPNRPGGAGGVSAAGVPQDAVRVPHLRRTEARLSRRAGVARRQVPARCAVPQAALVGRPRALNRAARRVAIEILFAICQLRVLGRMAKAG
ncbi:MAG: GNAT family N-acetyltransferase [Anaerolineae bacterium]|nr:GNAT family N-acetyltransferase [Anaerolineae bacterium]